MSYTRPAALIDVLYLPPVQYFAHWAASSSVVLEQCAPYVKGTWRNRCVIATAGGPLVLSVPLLSGKYLQPLRDVKIAYHEPWQRIHWRSIHDAYRKSPFFEFYADPLEAWFRQQPEYLVEWNVGLLSIILKALRLPADFETTEAFSAQAPDNFRDLRDAFAFKPRLQRPDPLYRELRYVQVFEDRLGFLPNLSILDLLFCTGPEAVSILLRSVINDKNETT